MSESHDRLRGRQVGGKGLEHEGWEMGGGGEKVV